MCTETVQEGVASGRAGTVLVVGEGDPPKAVVSTVVARGVEATTETRLSFVGPTSVDPSTASHVEKVVLPIVHRIMAGLGAEPRGFQLGVVNPGGTSAADLSVRVSGFSADLPVFLALLSYGLQLPVPDDVVATGHIASVDGDIRAVRFLPAKIAAAAAEGTIRRFVYPALDNDGSLAALSPREHRQAVDAVTNAPDRLRMIPVGDVTGLIRAVFDDEVIVLAGLEQAFFGGSLSAATAADQVGHAVAFLTFGNEDRFWRVLERHLLAGNGEGARRLLAARMTYQVRQKAYPRGLGRKLLQLVASLPPATRRLKALFPLLPMGSCIRLGQDAQQEDHEDFIELIDAATGKGCRTQSGVTAGTPSLGSPGQGHSTLDIILEQIDATAIARLVSRPIDAARASYIMDSVTVGSHEEFCDVIRAFYLHLLRHVENSAVLTRGQGLGAKAMALLERTYAHHGGLVAAAAEARDGIHGGLRMVLDAMTNQFRHEEQLKHIDAVLKEALDPLDSNARGMLMAALLQRLGPVLPDELRAAPPERFARQWETVVRAYAESLDRLKETLKTF